VDDEQVSMGARLNIPYYYGCYFYSSYYSSYFYSSYSHNYGYGLFIFKLILRDKISYLVEINLITLVTIRRQFD